MLKQDRRTFRRWSWHRRWVLAVLALCVTLTIGLTSCGGDKPKQTAGADNQPKSAIATGQKTNPNAPPASGSGRFKVLYSNDLKREFSKGFSAAYQKSGIYDKIATFLNRKIAIPRDVDIALKECGVINAFYSPKDHRITMCYEFTEYIYNTFKNASGDQKQALRAATRSTIFFFFHELGHALISELELPSTGREEDAADQFSTLLLAKSGGAAEKGAVDAATWFAIEGKKQKRLPYWDEHSFNLQRYFDIACLLYGSDPQQYESVMEQVKFPKARLVRCRSEYEKNAKAWRSLLAPHLKKGEIL